MLHQMGIKRYYVYPLSSILFCFQGELFVGDQSGAIHIWDLKTDHNEQLVRIIACIYKIILILRKEKDILDGFLLCVNLVSCVFKLFHILLII